MSAIVYSLVEASLNSVPPAALVDVLRYLATCSAAAVRAAIKRFDPPFPDAPE